LQAKSNDALICRMHKSASLRESVVEAALICGASRQNARSGTTASMAHEPPQCSRRRVLPINPFRVGGARVLRKPTRRRVRHRVDIEHRVSADKEAQPTPPVHVAAATRPPQLPASALPESSRALDHRLAHPPECCLSVPLARILRSSGPCPRTGNENCSSLPMCSWCFSVQAHIRSSTRSCCWSSAMGCGIRCGPSTTPRTRRAPRAPLCRL
jgi:hypothetical protein